MATILIVEDNLPLGNLYKRFLEHIGAAVTQATTCAETYDYLKTSAPPDVILLDMALPDGDGLEIIDYLRTSPHLAEVPFVVMSGNERYLGEMNKLGAADIFLKPVSIPRLAESVKKLLGERLNPDLLSAQAKV